MKRNHALWISPLLAIAGFLSYFFYFVEWAALRNFPWINLPLLLVAVGLSFYGLYRAWSGGWAIKVAGLLSSGFSLAVIALFTWYVFSFSYNVPLADQSAHAGDALPDRVLLDSEGSEVSLQEAASGKLILVFFRGHW